jgi:hypothetical protein
MRYRLRTLLILLAVGPPALAFSWSKYQEYLEYRDRQHSIPACVSIPSYVGISGATIHGPQLAQTWESFVKSEEYETWKKRGWKLPPEVAPVSGPMVGVTIPRRE